MDCYLLHEIIGSISISTFYASTARITLTTGYSVYKRMSHHIPLTYIHTLLYGNIDGLVFAAPMSLPCIYCFTAVLYMQ